MPTITINVPVMVEAEFDQFGIIRIKAVTWPSIDELEKNSQSRAVQLALNRAEFPDKIDK